MSAALHSQPSTPRAAYVGSEACKRCHGPTYERWSKTRMANVVLDPKQHPDAVLPDFTKADPLLTFKLDDVAFVYGSKWKQRYFARAGNDYYPLPAQWDVTHRVWRPYFVQPNTDWWVKFYPPTTPSGRRVAVRRLPLGELRREEQAGDRVERRLRRCHGPGGEHVRQPGVEHRQPGEARLRARERHVHSVPLTRSAAAESDRGACYDCRSASIKATA